jgi:hypothetical protein
MQRGLIRWFISNFWGIFVLCVIFLFLIVIIFFVYYNRIYNNNLENKINTRNIQIKNAPAQNSKPFNNLIENFIADTDPHEDLKNHSELVPVEWEKPLFEILSDISGDMESRNRRLIELATIHAIKYQAVQKECLMHLLYGLPDSDLENFVKVATHPSIPVKLRSDFLNETFNMRPVELSEPLATRLISHPEISISSSARIYLIDIKTLQNK